LSIDVEASIPLLASLLTIVLLTVPGGRYGRPWSATGVFALLFVCSMAPILWAYPEPHVLADEVWTLTGLFLAIAAGIVCASIRLIDPVIARARLPKGSARFAAAHYRPAWLPLAAGATVLALIWIMARRSQLPGINVLGVSYPNCITDDPAIGGQLAIERIAYTYFESRECDGRRSCDFHSPRAYDGQAGVGANACKTEIELSWTCGLHQSPNETRVGVDPNGGYSTPLVCH